ncbi:Swi5-domain-containing protein [Lipomyces arxii]|uniref:Swi5-domain-containing protein n=1 Tax=Lipomyces arxii TaxID=56418 RepID=UPI0034CF5F33
MPTTLSDQSFADTGNVCGSIFSSNPNISEKPDTIPSQPHASEIVAEIATERQSSVVLFANKVMDLEGNGGAITEGAEKVEETAQSVLDNSLHGLDTEESKKSRGVDVDTVDDTSSQVRNEAGKKSTVVTNTVLQKIHDAQAAPDPTSSQSEARTVVIDTISSQVNLEIETNRDIPTDMDDAAETVESTQTEETNVTGVLTSEYDASPNPNNFVDMLSAQKAKEEEIKSRIKEKQEKLAVLQVEYEEYLKKLKCSDPSKTIKRHIKLLKDYNAIRDIGLSLVGMIADTKGARVVDVMPEYGIGPED